MNVAAWLRALGLERYEQVFRENDVDGEVLPELGEADLEKLGVASLGHRKRLLKAIAALSGADDARSSASAASVPAPSVAGQTVTQAERRQLTVMFVDLVGSTALANRLDPEDMRDVIRAYQDACAGVVARFEGMVAKFMGDGVLAYFGFPQAHEDDAERAVHAGLGTVEAVGRLAAPEGTPLGVRVGIATGLVVVGDLVGKGTAQEQAVVGETPNLAARLQAVAEPGTVVIAQGTRRLVGGLFEYADLGRHSLKGFAGPLRAWRVLGPSRAEGRFEAMHGVAALAPVVGREQEVDLLADRWQRAKDGEGQVVLLTGEAGIGKSRLVQALHQRLGDEPHTRLRYSCSPYHQGSMLHPMVDQLERAAGLERDDPAERRLDKLEGLLARSTDDVAEVAPLMAALLSIPAGGRYPPLTLSPQRQKERTLEALVGQLERLARRQPVLVVWEDAHWSDPTSLELLGLSIDRAQAIRALVVITFRPEFVPPWARHPHVTALTLTRLSRRQATAMVDRLTGGKPLPAGVLEQILAKTDGVPLFVEELTKTVLEGGLLRDEGDRYELAGPLPPLAIPSTLQDSLMARLDRLAPVKEVAQVGAAIGREFSYELLAAVASLPEGELRGALAQLSRSELVFCRGTPPEATYSFKHALLRDVAHESLLKGRRQQLHARIASALEERFPETAEVQPELLALHYTEALLPDQAAARWMQAGLLAGRRSAHVEATAHFRKSLDLLRTLPETPERAKCELTVLLALGVSLQDVRGPGSDEVDEVYTQARRLCRDGSAAFEEFAAVWGLWRVQIHRQHLEAAYRLAGELLGLAERQGDPSFRLQAYHALWSTAQFGDDPETVLGFLRAGLALYDERLQRTPLYFLSGHDPAVCGHGSWAEVSWLLGHPEQAVAAIDACLGLARELRQASSLAHGLRIAVEFYLLCVDPGRLHALANELGALAAEQGFAGHLATATFGRGWALVLQGRAEEGSAHMSRGAASRRASGTTYRENLYQALLQEAYRRAGLRGALQALYEEPANADASSVAGRTDTVEIEIVRLRGELLLFLDPARQAAAQGCFEQAVAAARRRDAKSLELRAARSLARLWAERGEQQKAHDLLASVYGWFTEGLDTPDLKEAEALLEELASTPLCSRATPGRHSAIPGE